MEQMIGGFYGLGGQWITFSHYLYLQKYTTLSPTISATFSHPNITISIYNQKKLQQNLNSPYQPPSMSKNQAIDIILRVRPSKQIYKGFKFNRQQNKVQFFTPKNAEQGYINNKQQKRIFAFNQLFDMEAKQEKIFDKVAKDVVDSAINGYNGTIFAYGQTGSGKTFTMTGGTESFDDRGLIPRTLTYVFNQKRLKEEKIQVSISYIQIYQGQGYDLLTQQSTKNLKDLPRVQTRQGPNGQIILQNLKQHSTQSAQDALNLLLLGDMNRQVCKTPKNDQSTRSHCIFIIKLQTSKSGSDIKSQATIHLVDLSGSERIKQTGVEGKLQKEAIHINLGLHYLERVIVQLNKKARGQNVHVPYRQSLMTLILRDSIGGNCKTRMIATMSAKEQDIPESISTCKFAMRVALIKNDIERNETVDPGVIIARLKKENAQLKAELALLKGGEQVKQELDKYDIEDCQKMVEEFIKDQDPTAAIILTDRLKINQCFNHFKKLLKKGGFSISNNLSSSMLKNQNKVMMQNKSIINQQDIPGGGRAAQQLKRLKLLVQQKDNQITLLLSLISKKNQQQNGQAEGTTNNVVLGGRPSKQQSDLLRSVVKDKPISFKKEEDDDSRGETRPSVMKDNFMKDNSRVNRVNNNNSESSRVVEADRQEIQKMLIKPVDLTSQQLLDHARAFEQFRKAYRKHQAMQKNRAIINQKKQQGKKIGMIVNDTRNQINKLKSQLQELKRVNAVNSLVQGRQRQDPREQQVRDQMLELKEIYKTNFQKLKIFKMEIQSIQIIEKKNLQQLQKDFHKWVLFKQKERESTVQQLDQSLLKKSTIKDEEVNKHLESFFKARNQILKR